MSFRLKRWLEIESLPGLGEALQWQGLIRREDGTFEWGDADQAHNFTNREEVRDAQKIHGGMLMHDGPAQRDDTPIAAPEIGSREPKLPPAEDEKPHGRNWLRTWEKQHEE